MLYSDILNIYRWYLIVVFTVSPDNHFDSYKKIGMRLVLRSNDFLLQLSEHLQTEQFYFEICIICFYSLGSIVNYILFNGYTSVYKSPIKI